MRKLLCQCLYHPRGTEEAAVLQIKVLALLQRKSLPIHMYRQDAPCPFKVVQELL